MIQMRHLFRADNLVRVTHRGRADKLHKATADSPGNTHMKNSKPMKKNKKKSLVESLLMSEDVDPKSETAMFFEDDMTADATPDQPLDLQNISLDKKFDHFMIQYERESMPNSAMYQEPDLAPMDTASPAYRQENVKKRTTTPSLVRPPSLMAFLREAAEDDDAAGGDDPTAGAGGGGGDAGGSGTDPNKKPDAQPPTINVQNFARSMARLINNYETLCNPKSTMINRAKAYLLKNYDPNMAKEFMIMMETQYDLTPRLAGDKESQPGPPAAGSWGGGGGGGE
jgi:hypothetical protein